MRSAIALAVLALAGLGPSAAAGEEKPTELGKLAAELKPGEWRKFETKGFTRDLLLSSGKSILPYIDSGAWDASTRSLHLVGQCHLTPPPKHISYRADTNEWRAEKCPEWLAKLKWFHGYENTSADPVNGLVFHHPSASDVFHQLEMKTGKWTELPRLPGGTSKGHGTATTFFPEMGAKGSIVRFYAGSCQRFDMAAQKWDKVAGDFSLAKSYHNVAEYNPKHKTVLFGGGNGSQQLYSLAADGRVTALKPAPCNIGVAASHMAVCPLSGEVLVLNYRKESKGFYALDPADPKAEWRKLPDPPVGEGAVCTISTYGVVMHFNFGGVHVYRHAPAKAGKSG
jgi:hypothetical protein